MLNAAVRVISDTKKFDQGLSRLMHQELHWLDVPERVNYKLGVLTHRCLLGQGASVPIKLLHSSQSGSYTAASTLRCTSSTDRTSTSSQHLRSAGICCRWSLQTMFNTLPDDLRDRAVSTSSTFGQSLKTSFLRLSARLAHIRGVSRNAIYKCTIFTFTYLLSCCLLLFSSLSTIRAGHL